MKSLGASAVFDYHDSDCGAQIRAYTNNTLYHALDCISAGSSPQICADALSSTPPENTKLRYISLLATPTFPRKDDVLTKTLLAYTAFGEPLRFPE